MKSAIDQIIQLTAEEFGVMPQAIRGRTIARHFGKRDGQSMGWARKTVSNLMETNKVFRKSYERIESKIDL